MRILAALLVATFCGLLHASSVEWNTMEVYKWSLRDQKDVVGVENGYGSTIYAMIQMNVVAGDGGYWLKANSSFVGEGAGTRARLMNVGDVVGEASMGDGNEFFYAHYVNQTQGVVESAYDIFVEPDSVIYLGLASDSEVTYLPGDLYVSEDEVYGWVALGIDASGEVSMLGSAWDRDGGGMIVGGGAIPEPTAGMLLVLGLAALGLRRSSGVRAREHDIP